MNNMVNKDTTTQRDSLGELLGQLANNSATVVHDEIELLIRRIREKTAAGLSGVITVVIAASISFAAFLCLCAALVVWLTSYMPLLLAFLVTAAALALVAGIMAFIGYRKLKNLMHNTDSENTEKED